MASRIQDALIDGVPGLTEDSFSGSPTVSGPDADGVYQAMFILPSRIQFNAARSRVSRSTNPLTVTAGDDIVILASTPSRAEGDPGSAPSSPDAEKEADNSWIYIIIIVAVVLIVALILVFVLIRQRKSNQALASAVRGKETYVNPSYAVAHSTTSKPDWADPNYPFMSRAEAEAQLRQRGMKNGDYVIRQAASTVNGYIITAVNQGTFSNSQLKFVNGALTYGGMAVGGTIDEAISTLQTKVKISPSSGSPFFLAGGNAGVVDMDGEADA